MVGGLRYCHLGMNEEAYSCSRRCRVLNAVEVSEFSASLLDHVLHQPLCQCPGSSHFESSQLRVPFVLIARASDTASVRLYFHHPSPGRKMPLQGPAVIWQILPGQCSGGSTCTCRKLEDEKTPLFSTYRPGVTEASGLFRQTAMSASACTSSPSRSSLVTSSQASSHASICFSGLWLLHCSCRPWSPSAL